MKNKLLRLALLTSPMLALYGIMPIFLFNQLSFAQMAVSYLLLSLIIFLFWLLNIYLSKKGTISTKRYVLSYTAIILTNTVTYITIPGINELPAGLSFFLYPLVALLATNTIILLMIKAVLLERKNNLAETENQKLKVENLEAQKKVLLNQLHPHFLFNALSVLKSLIKENADEAVDYSLKLSEFLRYSVSAQINELSTVQEELQFTRDYLDLQKVRFGGAFSCSISVPESVYQKRLPVFALQTLVENAVKHNSFTEKRPLSITIAFENGGIKVSNNKAAKPLIRKSGTGLVNLNERYKLLSGSGIEIINDEDNFVVFLGLIEK